MSKDFISDVIYIICVVIILYMMFSRLDTIIDKLGNIESSIEQKEVKR